MKLTRTLENCFRNYLHNNINIMSSLDSVGQSLKNESSEENSGSGKASVTIENAEMVTQRNNVDCKDDVSTSSLKTFDIKPGDNFKGKGPLSIRAYKRLKRLHQLKNGPSEKQKKKAPSVSSTDLDSVSEEFMKETSHYFQNGLRKVYPYHFVYSTHAKGRWLGKTTMEVFQGEFRQETPEYYLQGIQNGKVKINGQRTTKDYRFRAQDFIENTIHRHELPVTSEPLEIIENSEKLLVVNKPSSIPVHPCGRFRHNSLTFILAKEFHLMNLRTIYRLDRLTSGLMIFAKSEAQAQLMQGHIRDRIVQKEYLAKVEGEFPTGLIECHEPLDVLSHKIGLWYVSPTGKQAHTTFERLSFNGKDSIVKCVPHTGRTHQIRIHLQYLGYPITNDTLYNSSVWGPNKGKGGEFGKSKDELMKELLEHHSREKHLESGVKVTENTPSFPDKNISEGSANQSKKIKLETQTSDHLEDQAHYEKPKHETSDAGPTFNPQLVTYDPDCSECKLFFRDPLPEELIMYLHALKYEGPGWAYKTSIPNWAREGGYST